MLTLRWKLIRLCVAVWLVATINYAQPGSVRANVLDDPELSGAIPSRGVARRWRFNDLTPAMLSQSGLTAFNPSDVVDGQVDDNAWHTDQSTAGAWLRVDLGAGNDRPFTEARVYARSSYNGVYDVEYSTNGSNWSVAYSGFQPTPAGWHAVQWTSVGPARYWRLRLTNTPGPGAWLSELEFNVAGSTTPPSSWDVSPYNYDNQRCADACTGVVYSHTTVPNFTMDIPRAVTLVYSSERALPKPLIALYVDTPSGGADEVWLQVNRSGSGLMTFVNGETTLKFKPHSSGSTVIGGRLNVSGLSTGMYDIEVIVTWVKAGTATTDPTWLTKLMVVDESNSPFGRGWMLAGWQRLYVQSDGSALITQGDGSAVYFKKSGSAFISPPGDFTTLKTTGYGWVRQYKDSTQVHFNTSGQTAAMVDPFGTQQLHFHYTNGRIDKITHPGSRYHYIDYGTYGISKVRTSLSPDRPTTYTVQSNGTLTQIKDPDNISTNLQYDGNLQLWKVTARNGGITTFEYDTTRGELTKRIDPSVAIYPSGSQSPTTILYPYTHRFVPDGSTAGAPKSTTSAGNEYGTIVPPGGNESDWQTLVFVRPDHFRASTHTIVPENHQTWTSYDDDGLPVRVKVNGYGFDSITAGWGIDSIQYTERVIVGSCGLRI